MGDFTQNEMDDESDLTEQGESREVKVIKDPGLPSKEEYDKHMVTHTPLRPWCPHCVRGEAVAKPHKKNHDRDRTENNVPVVSLDYMYMNSATQVEEAQEGSDQVGHPRRRRRRPDDEDGC